MKYKVGDIVRTTKKYDKHGNKLFPVGTIGKIVSCNEESKLPYRVETEDDYFFYSDDMLELFSPFVKTYEDGLNDVWQMVNEILYADTDDLKKAFGNASWHYIFKDNTPLDALAKWEAHKAAQNKIKVGDVVLWEGVKGCVLDIISEDMVMVLDENGCIEEWKTADVKKTGELISVVDSILKELRGCE